MSNANASNVDNAIKHHDVDNATKHHDVDNAIKHYTDLLNVMEYVKQLAKELFEIADHDKRQVSKLREAIRSEMKDAN